MYQKAGYHPPNGTSIKIHNAFARGPPGQWPAEPDRTGIRPGSTAGPLLADVGAGADVLVLVRVEGLAVLREVPLDGLVHELPVAGAQVEGDHGGGLLGALGDRLVRPDVLAAAGRGGLGAAP